MDVSHYEKVLRVCAKIFEALDLIFEQEIKKPESLREFRIECYNSESDGYANRMESEQYAFQQFRNGAAEARSDHLLKKSNCRSTMTRIIELWVISDEALQRGEGGLHYVFMDMYCEAVEEARLTVPCVSEFDQAIAKMESMKW
jgi:hypothetical protein